MKRHVIFLTCALSIFFVNISEYLIQSLKQGGENKDYHFFGEVLADTPPGGGGGGGGTEGSGPGGLGDTVESVESIESESECSCDVSV